jgi:endonuclease G
MAGSGQGYNTRFLGKGLALPAINTAILAPLKKKKGFEIKYTHYSTFVHASRRLPVMTAVNIKGEAFHAPKRSGKEPWEFSDQIEPRFQIDNRFYANDENTFDRGHLVRRIDPCWGDQNVVTKAERETFRWTNCTPQHKKLNEKGGIWYQLEQHVMEHGVENKIADVNVFAGPVLGDDDMPFKKTYLETEVKIPVVFWKVIAWKKTDGSLNAVGFMMSQWKWVKNKLKTVKAAAVVPQRLSDTYFETLKFTDHKTYQVPISAIEKATGIKFGWDNVVFPYRTENYKAIGVERKLKNVFDLTTVQSKSRKARPFGRRTVDRFVRTGYAGVLKRYELKGVVL